MRVTNARNKAVSHCLMALSAIITLVTSCTVVNASDLDPGNYPGATDTSPPSLLLDAAQLERAVSDISGTALPEDIGYSIQKGRADSYLGTLPSPFSMPDIHAIRYREGTSNDGVDNSMDDAINRLRIGTNIIRTLALQYALTSEAKYAQNAVTHFLSWAESHTPINIYDFNPDFPNASIVSATIPDNEKWSFALDSGFQVYGLLNACDAFLLLSGSGYELSAHEKTAILDWIKRLAAAVASCHDPWIKYIESRPNLPATHETRMAYTANNHLTWHLAGLLAAAVTLNDTALEGYARNGSAWTDTTGVTHSSTLSFPALIQNAIIDESRESDTFGMLYEELHRTPAVGYALFHLQAITICARILQLHFDTDDAIVFSDDSALMGSFKRYSDMVSGTIPPPVTGENMASLKTFSCFPYEMVDEVWQNGDYADFTSTLNRSAFIDYCVGPVGFFFGSE